MADKPGSTVNFRKLLLNRCQKEFEKDKADDDVFEKKQKELEAATTVSAAGASRPLGGFGGLCPEGEGSRSRKGQLGAENGSRPRSALGRPVAPFLRPLSLRSPSQRRRLGFTTNWRRPRTRPGGGPSATSSSSGSFSS